jgi:hypothetical protein
LDLKQVPNLGNLPREDGKRVCAIPPSNSTIIFTIGGIIVDLMIITFITARLIKVLHKLNKQVLQRPVNLEDKNRRTLFIAVVYWNFLRILVAVLASVVAILSQFQSDQVWSMVMRAIVNIIISYVVTIDAEVVKETKESSR